MARIYPPTSGTLSVRGNVAPLIEMGAGFNPELSGHDNILLNGAMLGFSRKEMEEKVDGIFEFTGLREFADLPLKYYSSGMYIRLAFAIATEIDPDILLIDESLGAGDAAFLDKAKARIREPARPLERRRDRLARPADPPRALHPGHLDEAGSGRRRRPDRRGHRPLHRRDHGRLGRPRRSPTTP